MTMAAPTTAPQRQRALLLCLDEITDLQEQALESGDLLALNQLSERRAQAVRAAADYVPPALDWDAETEALALHVKVRSESLQQSIRSCMAAIRKELVALTERQHVAQYLAPSASRRGAKWQV